MPPKGALKLPLRDGDVERDDEAYKGAYFVLGDDEGHTVLGVAAVDGDRLPDIGVGQPDDAGDHLGVGFLSRHGLVLRSTAAPLG